MSRMGKKPIALDDRVQVEVSGKDVSVTGPKGTLAYTLPEQVSVSKDGNALVVECDGALRTDKMMHGLARSLLQGMVTGVTEGFRKVLEIQGQVLPPEHPFTLRTMSTLATTIRDQGRYREAEKLCGEVLKPSNECWGGSILIRCTP